jgi:putative tricarboxylic transport membrane protein
LAWSLNVPDFLQNLTLGFNTALSLHNLGFALLGCTLGTIVGVLPGVGPLATLAMLLPLTYSMDPTAALIMLAGIFYGSQYGGSTTAILLKIPGESSSVVTMQDGNEMARQGHAGVALSAAAISSFIGGTIGTLLLAALAVPLTAIVFSFGPAEYFLLMVLGLLAAVALSNGAFAKSIGMIVLGLLLGLVGPDVETGTKRFTFGFAGLWDGMDITAVAIGLFALSDIIWTLAQGQSGQTGLSPIHRIWPRLREIRAMMLPSLRGTTVGSLVGMLPGAGVTIASFLAYAVEKRVSATPQRFGKGAVEGVASPEAANNAAAQTSFVPTLMLGIPGSASMALIMGAMMIHDIQPGPRVISSNPALFWGLIASMWIGNLILVILNLPLVGLWVRLLKIPFHLLFPAILLFSCIGIYSARATEFDLYIAALAGVMGLLCRKFDCPLAPLILGFVIAPILEESFRRTLVLSRGSFLAFGSSPLAIGLILISVVFLTLMVRSNLRAAVADDDSIN